MKDETIIGLEVHVQLNTQSKLFCSCTTRAEEPNTAICPVCLGHPGSKPVLNAKALEHGAKLALALGCTIAQKIHFSRKTYFYPDLPKNYQITQYETPLGRNGQIVLDNKKVIRIQRVHMEEDPGALIHETGGVLVDYNRSGIPLCEIVTEPDMNSPSEAREFMKKILGILNYLGVYSQDCVIKADANVSIKEKGYTRVEIKNITGFKEIESALNYEVNRQKEQEVRKETRGWNAEKGITISQRSKEEEDDYGYIAEPDLPLFEISEEWIRKVQESIPELAEQKAMRWISDWKIDDADARIISEDLDVALLFEKVAARTEPVITARWFRKELLRMLNDKKKELNETEFEEKGLTELFKLLSEKKITDRIGQRIIRQLAEKKFSPEAYVKEQGLEKIGNEEQIKNVCAQMIAENKKAADDYKKGEEKALQFLIGQVMRHSKGRTVPGIVKEILKSLLE